MRTIPLTKGKEAIVDDEWFPILAKWSWYFSGAYAVRSIGPQDGGESVHMHRYITMASSAYDVDHINNNKLDNREANLRIVLPAQNYFNRPLQANNKSGYKGVCFDSSRGLYMATISAHRKQYNLGRYSTPEEAARAYNRAARELHGEHAWLNDV